MEGFQQILPFQHTVIAPIGDIQWTSRWEYDVAVSSLKHHIEKVLAYERQGCTVRFIGTGDYIDFMSPSNRRKFAGTGLFDSTIETIDDTADSLVHSLYEEILKSTRGKWLGLLRGHHFHKYESGETSDTRLCKLLQTRHLGDSCYIQLIFKEKKTSGQITLWAHHGQGSGTKLHSMLLKLENLLPFWDADVFFVGHLPKLAHSPASRIYPSFTNGGLFRLRHKLIHLVNAGGWYKSYIENAKRGQEPAGNYPEKEMLHPVVLGGPLYHVNPRFHRPRDSQKGRTPSGGYRQHEYWEPESWVEV